MEYEKKFICIGNMNAITYKEIFPLIKRNKLWLGINSPKEFILPEKIDRKNIYQNTDGNWVAKMGNILWFTNIDHYKRHENLSLCNSYKKNKEDYPFYDNYDAIEVSKVRNIPYDYDGVMGVPITFLDKWNPEQFEIVGATESEGRGFSNGLWDPQSKISQPLVSGQRKYKRLFVRNLNPVDSPWDLMHDINH